MPMIIAGLITLFWVMAYLTGYNVLGLFRWVVVAVIILWAIDQMFSKYRLR